LDCDDDGQDGARQQEHDVMFGRKKTDSQWSIIDRINIYTKSKLDWEATEGTQQ
jgi:hypothetical protein